MEVQANGQRLKMEVDTGAVLSVISQRDWNALFPTVKLKPTRAVLRTYTGQHMKVLGEISVRVQYCHQTVEALPLVMVREDGPCLLGRNWLACLQLDWKSLTPSAINHVGSGVSSELLEKYQEVFTNELGTIKGHTAKLAMKDGASPQFHRAYQVPFAVKDAVERELDRLEEAGVMEKVDHSDWATPIITVPKKDGRVRICGDYRATVNQSLDIDQYPLPRLEELFSKLAGGKRFTKLDLSHAYNQLLLEDESRKYLTVNTHKGLYQYNRLPFGVACAPVKFQKVMETIMQGLPNVLCYIDDILVTGRTEREHLETLEEVLRRLKEHGVRMNRAKCQFLAKSVEYLGYRIDEKGLHATDEKLQAITQAPPPKNVQELRSFLGLINYYGRFIPNSASILHPLNQLLHKQTKWVWSKECERSFKLAKEKLVSTEVLAHYDPALELKLAADASAYGAGAVLSHVMQDGTERPIAFASHTLSSAEQNYAQVEKEALALVFGIK